MVSLNKDLANVVGGTTARACDNCISKRARLYCAADDAFLCQSCDGSIHAANPLASRHERVHIKVASLKLSSSPPWHQGFTRKPRTPRKTRKTDEVNGARVHLVPEIGNDEMNTITSCDQGQDQDQDQDQEQVLYQVPVFDRNHHGSKPAFELNSFNGLMLPTDVELAEFAADVESLLGKGLDGECFAMEGLGLLDCREKDSSMERSSVKVEDDERIMETMKDPFDELSFDYDSPMWEEKDDQKVVVEVKEDVDDDVNVNMRRCDDGNKKNCRILKLDLEGIMAAWDEQRSPWTTGDRPELDPDDCWPECMGGCGIMHHHHHYNNNHGYGDHMGMMMNGNPAAMLDGGREARVSRYREKRRTRLFSKKIRYEVRKLNAEKRPRMKGRFVKRSTSSSSSFP